MYSENKLDSTLLFSEVDVRGDKAVLAVGLP